MPICNDIDNYFKIVLDTLKHYKVITNDKLIMKILAQKQKH